MFQNIKKVESNTGKGYRKIGAKFELPSKIENQFKSADGVKDAWIAFRQYTRENSLIHQDFVDYIENEILPILHIMLKDIHLHMQGMKQNKQLYTHCLWDCRKRADSVITRLNTDIYLTVNMQEKQKSPYVIPKRDPLLTKQGKYIYNLHYNFKFNPFHHSCHQYHSKVIQARESFTQGIFINSK